jgi:hypothetical protein
MTCCAALKLIPAKLTSEKTLRFVRKGTMEQRKVERYAID